MKHMYQVEPNRGSAFHESNFQLSNYRILTTKATLTPSEDFKHPIGIPATH